MRCCSCKAELCVSLSYRVILADAHYKAAFMRLHTKVVCLQSPTQHQHPQLSSFFLMGVNDVYVLQSCYLAIS